jgi:hypothetical protein
MISAAPARAYFILAGWFLMFALALANGIYAMVRPASWLQAKWTFTRGLDRKSPLIGWDEIGIRWGWGLFFLASAAFLGWVMIRLLIAILNWPVTPPLR